MEGIWGKTCLVSSTRSSAGRNMGKNVTEEFGEDCWSWKRRVEILCFAQDDRETAAVNGRKQRGKG